MPFDPTLPINNTVIDADELRAQFNGLKTLIDAVPAGPAGPAGATGPAGADGSNGADGLFSLGDFALLPKSSSRGILHP